MAFNRNISARGAGPTAGVAGLTRFAGAVCLVLAALSAAGVESSDICGKHQVAERICPFCKPELIETSGFCVGHDVPEALCTRCNAALIPAFKAEGDWCGEHGLPESQCAACNPSAKDKWAPAKRVQTGFARPVRPKPVASTERDPTRLWCSEHDVYEDECFICHPDLKDGLNPLVGKPKTASTGQLICKEHDVPEHECGICHPELAGDLQPGESLKIRLLSRSSALKAGIETARPRLSKSSPGLVVFCEARYNQNRVARITPLAPGVIHRVLVDVGQEVAEGDVLVEIASSEVAAAKRDYLVAMVDQNVKALAYKREKRLLEKEISAQQDFQQAKAEYEMAKIVTTTARQKLLNYRFTEAEIKQIEGAKSSSSLVNVRAPYAGTLVERAAVVGEAVEPGTRLFTLVDLSTMWLELAVPENQIDRVRPGLTVEATFRGLPGVTVRGELVWVDSRVHERTRLIKARALIQNPDVRLKSSMFGEVKLVLNGPVSTLRLPAKRVQPPAQPVEPAVRVPASALQRFEGQAYVFVKEDEDLFHLRRVVVGEKNAHWVEILRGIGAEEEVVVTGGFTMKSEFLKSRLGAGCVDE